MAFSGQIWAHQMFNSAINFALVIEVQRLQEQRQLVAKSLVQAPACQTHALQQLICRGRLIPMGPEHMHGPVHGCLDIKFSGSRHALNIAHQFAFGTD